MLGGRYETLKAIASGGMATVHLGRAVGVGGFERLVAIKVMHPHIAGESEFVDMFLDEARLAARIRHPNVVATIDVQADDGLFIVMEYVDGPSLRALRRAWRRALPPPIALRILIDALGGLHAAHELCGDDGAPLNLVHRDVSPANILIGADGVVRITDFGVARAETRLSSTRGGQLKGKVPYMPPEQLMGEPIDRRCDVYGSGAVLWEQLAGRRLFRAESEGALLQKILAGPEYTPQQVNADVPAALDAVCMRALARSPDDRYATAADFADALEEAAATAGITIASTRTLARFVDESGAHEKLDPRRIAELRQGPRDAMASIPSRPSLSSYDDSHSGSGQGSAPSVSRGRSVTGAVATLSASHQPTPKRSSRTILVGGALLLAGLAGGFVLAQRGGGADSGDRVDASPAAVAAPEAAPEAAATSTPALASASAGADEPSDEATGDSAPSDATPTASASAPPPKSTPKPVRAAAPRPPKPRPAAKPTSNSYDPDRL